MAEKTAPVRSRSARPAQHEIRSPGWSKLDERKIFNGQMRDTAKPVGAPTLKDTYHWRQGQTDSGRGVKRMMWDALVKIADSMEPRIVRTDEYMPR
ncbi:hypothetical protein THAOC_35115 [Thalassiosira oceanica]|uniref:Uncharacterized protein n=1 Tax=Thalassiosira oceanica TaxID=159749 RepID=K0R1E6_THAOC|nr:hypothetical protein THAOC_35115 [Thalassiosira oceanica]|eukprot:EJK46228.1 hypothetical protein THAOC_35115 [Thalassiosira oceanica]